MYLQKLIHIHKSVSEKYWTIRSILAHMYYISLYEISCTRCYHFNSCECYYLQREMVHIDSNSFIERWILMLIIFLSVWTLIYQELMKVNFDFLNEIIYLLMHWFMRLVIPYIEILTGLYQKKNLSNLMCKRQGQTLSGPVACSRCLRLSYIKFHKSKLKYLLN